MKTVSSGAALADMALLLMVFFMVATNQQTPEDFDVEVPVAKTQGAEQDNIYIFIDRKENLFYNNRRLSNEQFAAELERVKMQGVAKEKKVAITADKNISYKRVREIMATLRQNEFLNILFMAEPRE